MDMDFMRALEEALKKNRCAVMATVVEARGSVPREAGAKMLVFLDGSTFGTVGGGAIEKHVTEEARKMLGEEGTRLLDLNLKNDLGMECGGEAKVYLESIRAAQRLVVFGGGHIGQALYLLAPLMGLVPVIIDERAAFCNAERFPRAELLCAKPEEALERLSLSPRDHVVIVTHRHVHDYECLKRVSGFDPAYVGMIGSRRKVAGTLDKLKEEGIPAEKLERVHAPVGLNLGGRTPGAIAIAIAAEIIAVAHGKRPDGAGW
jgi:xanthine dehydrogenase accessory factor